MMGCMMVNSRLSSPLSDYCDLNQHKADMWLALDRFEKVIREDEREKRKFNSPTLYAVIDLLQAHRRQGSTTALASIAKNDKNALVVVGNYAIGQIIMREHNLEERQISGISNLASKMCGRNGPILFDLTAVISLLETIKREAQNEVTSR